MYSYSCYKKNWLIFSPEEVFQCAFYKKFNSSSFRGNSPFTDDDDKGQWASFFIKIKYLNLMQAIKNGLFPPICRWNFIFDLTNGVWLCSNLLESHNQFQETNISKTLLDIRYVYLKAFIDFWQCLYCDHDKQKRNVIKQ